MLEEDKEWANFVVVVIFETILDHVKELLCKSVVVEAVVHVSLRESDSGSRLLRSVK